MTRSINLYDAEGADFSAQGYGPVAALSATFSETGNGDSVLNVDIAYDDRGLWTYIRPEMILSAYVPVRMTPELDDGDVVTGVEKWTVKQSASKSQRTMYTTKNGDSKMDRLPKGLVVTVVRKPTDAKRYKIKATGYGTGWIDYAALEYVVSVTLPSDPTAIETVAPPWTISKQLFRIHHYTRNETSISVEARHITYDLLGAVTKFYSKGAVEAQTALTAILGNTLTETSYTIQSNIAGTRTGVDWRYINPITALLDPEKGFIARWGGYLIRDNYEMTVLAEVGTNRGVEISYGKNLQGVEVQVDYSDVVVGVLPLGRDKDGKYLLLTDDGSGDIIYIDGADSAVGRIYILDCAGDATVKDDVGVNLARTRMREKAQEIIDGGADIPKISMTVDFLQLGDTDEYSAIRDLERIYLYDWVRISYPGRGIDSLMQITSIEFDPINQRFVRMELGDGLVSLDTLRLASFQIPGGLNGYKILPGTIGGGQLDDDVISTRHIQSDSITTRTLQAESITAEKIAAGAITADKITAGAIVTEKLAAGSVTAEKIAAGAIDTDKLSAGAVTAEKIEAGTITAQQLKAGLITADSGLIAVGAIQTAQIADGSITSAKIVSLDADVITSGTLKTDRLLLVGEGGVVYEINALSSGLSQTELSDEKYRSYINGTVIVANSITAAQIAAGTITANEIAANAITAAKINVADLFASEATISAINAMDIRSNTYLQLYVGDRIDGISVGGRNLWLRTREYDPTKYDGWTGGGAPYTAIDGFGVQRIAGAWNDISQNVPVEAGAEYTLSAWIKWEDAANTGTFYLFHSGGSVTVTSQVGAQDYARVSATYVETGSTSSCRFECGTDAPYLIYGLKLEKGNKATDWSPAPEDPVSELQAGSVVEINKNRVKISTPEFAVDIPTTEGMDVQVNEKGFSAPVIVSPTVAKAKPGGVYTVGAGGDYACLADAFGDINNCVLSDDVILKMVGASDAGGVIRGVSGPGQVIIAPINLCNFADTAAWELSNVSIGQLASDGGVAFTVATAGTWRSATLNIGSVGVMGLRGKAITFSVKMYGSSGASSAMVLQAVIYVGSKAIRYISRPAGSNITEQLTGTGSVVIPETAGFWDELKITFWVSQSSSIPKGNIAYYRDIRLEIGGEISGLATGKTTVTLAGLRAEGCAAQIICHEAIFPTLLECRNTAMAVNRCTFTGTQGFYIYGGSGYMDNCYGSCSDSAVYAGGGGAISIYGSAPSGWKGGLLETSEMDAGDPPSGGTPDPEVSKTITAKATSSGTYDGVNGWWSSDAALRQGYVSGNGRLRGGVWFDLSALPSGATITKLTLRLRRVEGYGKGSAVDVRIYGTTAGAKSGDPAASGKISSSYVSGSMEPGKTKTFDVTSLKAYTGFVLYAADTSVLSGKSYSTNYARFTGTGGGDDTIPMLTVTYTA